MNTSLDYGNMTLCLGKAGLVAGTTTTITIANTITYAIQSKLYSKTNATNAATPTTDIVTGATFVGVPINNGCAFLVGLDTSGAIKVAQGPLQALDTSGNFIVAPQFPELPSDAPAVQGSTTGPYCAIGYIIIKVGSTGATWTFGASNLSGATGLTYAFQDVVSLPSRPQVA